MGSFVCNVNARSWSSVYIIDASRKWLSLYESIIFTTTNSCLTESILSWYRTENFTQFIILIGLHQYSNAFLLTSLHELGIFWIGRNMIYDENRLLISCWIWIWMLDCKGCGNNLSITPPAKSDCVDLVTKQTTENPWLWQILNSNKTGMCWWLSLEVWNTVPTMPRGIYSLQALMKLAIKIPI